VRTPATPFPLEELARRIGAELRGRAAPISGVAPLESAGPSQIAFYSNPRYRKDLQTTRAGAVIVCEDDVAHVPASAARLVSPQPYVAFAKASALFHSGLVVEPGLQRGALVDETAEVHPTAAISPGAYVGPGARIGARTTLHAGAHVEVGACSCIDRATLGETVIGRGTKIDNLVQVGHNVRVGPLCLLVAQCGISGSTELGQGVVLAGQVGVVGHLRIGDGARVGAQAGVAHDVADGETVTGYPAIAHRDWLRMSAALPRVPELLREVRRLQQRVEQLEKERE